MKIKKENDIDMESQFKEEDFTWDLKNGEREDDCEESENLTLKLVLDK